jgi:hypothetical protein
MDLNKDMMMNLNMIYKKAQELKESAKVDIRLLKKLSHYKDDYEFLEAHRK